MFSYTVSEVNRFIKQIFSYEQIFYNINIKGEISNFKHHNSGNIFFTLKDENSAIKCVMFKMQADLIDFIPKDGMLVNISGDINIYEKTGTYQIYVTKIRKQGDGLIQKELIDLHQKLKNEGLFDQNKKIPIIKFPKVIGIVTAPNSAALQDVIQILSRRLPILKLKIFPCLVQGFNAANSIVKAINKASVDCEIDNLIICRGGGSQEDLDPFNDEKVCRAAFKCKKPIISAIGHETDNCLLDLIADLRASTPSSAAELVCISYFELLEIIKNREQFIKNNFDAKIEKKILKLKNLQSRLEFVSPKNFFNNLELKIDYSIEKINKLISQTLLNIKNNIDKNYKMLKILNPLNILNKGYCLAFYNNEKNQIVKSIYRTKKGDELKIIFSKGELKVKIIEKNLKNK